MIDTGSSISLIQPGVYSTPVKQANVTPYKVTVDELKLKREQLLKFKIKGEWYSHAFCLCALFTDADNIIGTDFLGAVNTKLDLSEEKLWLDKVMRVNHDSLKSRHRESHGTAARSALTVFTTTDGRVKQKSCLIRCRDKQEKPRKQKGVNKLEMRILESEPWLFKTTETIRFPPDSSKWLQGV